MSIYHSQTRRFAESLIRRFAESLIRSFADSLIWLVLLFSVFAWSPLLTPAYFLNAHDAKHSLFFLVEFDQTFRDGFLWPRWSPDFSFGYGYPLFNLYAPLSFYAAEIVHLMGAGFATSIKTIYVLATIGAGFSMYGFVKSLFGSRAGLLAAVVYMYVPFHLVEIFVRSAYAEFVALAIIPLVFWSFTELINSPSLRRTAVAGLSYGLLALIHHTSFFTFSPFLMLYILYLILVKTRFRVKKFIRPTLHAAGAGVLGLSLSAIYLIPVVMETKYIKVEQWTSGSYNYLQHFVYFSQLFSPEWGYGYAGIGLLDDFSYQLGIVMVVLIVAALVSVQKTKQHYNITMFFLISTIAIILLMSPLAETVWRVLPIAPLVQFPWRLLSMTAFTMSIAAGSLASSQDSPAPLYIMLLVLVLASFPYTMPQYTEVPDWAETPLAVINWDKASIVDRVGMVSVTEEQPQTSPMEQEYIKYGRPLTVAGIISGQGTVETIHHGGASDIVKVTAQKAVTVQFYSYDYPGWQVTVNGQPVNHRYEPPYGLVTVDLPGGEHTVQLRMGSTPPRTVGGIISGLALVFILAGFFIKEDKSK